MKKFLIFLASLLLPLFVIAQDIEQEPEPPPLRLSTTWVGLFNHNSRQQVTSYFL
jgi:hypothetical protein